MASDPVQETPEAAEAAPPLVPPPGTVYYTQYGQARIEHPRVAAVGVLNLIFFFPYLVIALFLLLGTGNPLSAFGMEVRVAMDFSTILAVVCLALGSLLLLCGGILLLNQKAAGKWITQAAAVILAGYVIYNLAVTLAGLQGGPRSFDTLMVLWMVLLPGLLLVYPLLAFILITRPSRELALH